MRSANKGGDLSGNFLELVRPVVSVRRAVVSLVPQHDRRAQHLLRAGDLSGNFKHAHVRPEGPVDLRQRVEPSAGRHVCSGGPYAARPGEPWPLVGDDGRQGRLLAGKPREVSNDRGGLIALATSRTSRLSQRDGCIDCGRRHMTGGEAYACDKAIVTGRKKSLRSPLGPREFAKIADRVNAYERQLASRGSVGRRGLSENIVVESRL